MHGPSLSYTLQGGPSGRGKPPVELNWGCSTNLPGQQLATVAAQQLPELSELSQLEVVTEQRCHPVEDTTPL